MQISRWLLLALASAFCSFANAQSESYPSKPIRFVVPAPVGGGSDNLARIVGQKMSESMGQPVIIENRPGANSIIGTNLVAKAAPDGYTLLLVVDSTMTMHPFIYKKLPYDPYKELVAVTTMANSPDVLISHASLPVNSVPDLIALAKAQPGKLSVATGTLTNQAIAARFAMLAGIKLLHVPYNGSAAVAQALLAGSVNVTVDGFTPYRATHGQGRFKVLATTGTRRSTALPDVPTFEELGFPGFENGVWLGMAVPAGTPVSIINKLSDEVAKILAMPDVLQRFAAVSLEPLPGNPTTTAQFIKSEAEKWSKVIRDAGISID